MANKENELGALWKREMRNDSKEEYFGGSLEVTEERLEKWKKEGKINITVFNNRYCTEENNQPFYRVYETSVQKGNNTQFRNRSAAVTEKKVESVEETEECEELL